MGGRERPGSFLGQVPVIAISGGRRSTRRYGVDDPEIMEASMKTHSANSTISVAMALAFTMALAVAVLVVDAPVHAQAPAVVPAQPKINLTLEQRHVIKELIKDLNIQSAPKNTETTVGATVPATINLNPMPQVVGEKVPQIKSHLFFVEDGKVVIVDPKENKIVDAID
jgi:hypothetical protein